MSHLASKLRTIRKMHGYKQEYVGNLLGLSQAGYSKIEVGEVEINMKHIEKLAELYKTTPEKLVSTEGMNVSIDTLNNNDHGIVINHGPISHNYKQIDSRLQKLEDALSQVINLLEKPNSI